MKALLLFRLRSFSAEKLLRREVLVAGRKGKDETPIFLNAIWVSLGGAVFRREFQEG